MSDNDELKIRLRLPLPDDLDQRLRKPALVFAIQVCRRLVEGEDTTVTFAPTGMMMKKMFVSVC